MWAPRAERSVAITSLGNDYRPVADILDEPFPAGPDLQSDWLAFWTLDAARGGPPRRSAMCCGGGSMAIAAAQATAADTQTPYLKQFLGFIGITDVEFVYAEGLALGDESRNNSIAAAQAGVRRIVKDLLDSGYDGGFSMEPRLGFGLTVGSE